MSMHRLFGLIAALVAVSCLEGVSPASAASSSPLFAPASGQLVVGTSGLTIISLDLPRGEYIDCTSSVFHGLVSSSLLLGNASLRYLGCTSSSTTKSGCPVEGLTGGLPGLLSTETLHGILGLILPSGETGILLLPVTGTAFIGIEGNECTFSALILGSLIGLLTPVGTRSTTGKIIFSLSGGTPVNRSIDLTHGLGRVTSKLVYFSFLVGVEQTQSLTFSVPTEVT